MLTVLVNPGNRPNHGVSSEVLDIRQKFFMMRVMGHWHSLPREAVGATSLEVFKARLDEVLNNLV